MVIETMVAITAMVTETVTIDRVVTEAMMTETMAIDMVVCNVC